MGRTRIFYALCVMFCSALTAFAASADLRSGAPCTVPVPGMVTMLDLGATSCIPCKMMVPVMDSLSSQYQGKIAVVFIDVWKNPAQAEKFGIRAIPTQIFYDKNGKEYQRHEGYFEESAIEKILREMGVE